MGNRTQRVLALALVLVSACSGEPEVDEGAVSAFATTTCTTEVVKALSQQIIDEVACMLPGQLVLLQESGSVVFVGHGILPYLDEDARADLVAAAAGAAMPLRITSAYRTVAQQYLVRAWFERGLCGVPAAAMPGESNHETGRAVDVDGCDAWLTPLAAHGWMHDVPGDDVHFDHVASADHRGADVLAFQRLWNRNHPDDAIDEDGVYGAATAARVAASPAVGFALPGPCAGGP